MLSFTALRAEAISFGHTVDSDVIKFIDNLEAKQTRLEASKAELVAAGYTVTDPVTPA